MTKSKEPIQQTTTEGILTFHWGYIILPMVILLLTIILIACFYHQLPVEVAYRFQSDGSPDGWLSHGMVILWMLPLQFLLTLLAGAITWGITKAGARFGQPESTGIKPKSILLLMGNIIALPQAILCFAMLDIFIYNSYQIHILPLWVFALIIMGLGGIILGIFFIRAVWQVWGAAR
ncbi:DUF1648 domain-containing protein [Chloroflexota bacterium]